MKTNCRQIVNPDYLGAYSLDSGNYSYIEKEGVILSCARAQVMGTRGKETKIVAQTNLGKPLILNVTAQKVLIATTKSRYIEDWNNVSVIFYVKQNERAADGGRVDAIRIKANPKAGDQNKLPLLKATDTETVEKIRKALIDGYELDVIKKKWNIEASLEFELKKLCK